jgi:hypothetical protein
VIFRMRLHKMFTYIRTFPPMTKIRAAKLKTATGCKVDSSILHLDINLNNYELEAYSGICVSVGRSNHQSRSDVRASRRRRR